MSNIYWVGYIWLAPSLHLTIQLQSEKPKVYQNSSVVQSTNRNSVFIVAKDVTVIYINCRSSAP